MDSVVIAATIGVAGTVIVALGGFWSTKRATVVTLDAAREDRIWGKRAAAYERAIAALLYRHQQRQAYSKQLVEPLTFSENGLQKYSAWRSLWADQAVRVEDVPVLVPQHGYFPAYPVDPWFGAEAALLAYATPKIIKALNAAREANDAVQPALDRCWKLRPELQISSADLAEVIHSEGTEAAQPDDQADAAFRAAQEDLEAVCDEVERKDNELVNAIRAGVDERPSK